jgi:hypothetical protein
MSAKLNLNTLVRQIAYHLAVYGPWRITCNPRTRFGAWCLRNAGGW